MPLMGSIYVGASGLQAHNNALNTAAHNLSNIETKGYTRQQVLFGNKFYNTIGNGAVADLQVGIGVDYTKCRQVRDVFLDASLRKESGRGSFYEICAESTNEIETLFNEFGGMEGAAFADSVKNLWVAVQELQKTPTSVVAQGLFVSTCSQFLERAVAVSDGLNAYQDNLNSRIKGIVDDVNDIIKRVDELNIKIQKAEIGLEEANDIRDERNYLLDNLSKMVNTKVVENVYGGVELYIEGTPVLIGENVAQLDYKDNGYGFYDVTFGTMYDDMPVYDFQRTVCAEYDTDIGELKAIIMARGDHRSNYSDLEKYPNDADASREYYEKGRTGINPSTGKRYNDVPVSVSVVMRTQAEFDKLIHNITTAINNFLTDNARKSSDTEGHEIFVRLGTDRFDGAGNYVVENTGNSWIDVSTMYTVANLKINPDLLKEPTLNNFFKADKKSEDREKADAFAAIFTGNAKVCDMNKYAGGATYDQSLVDAKWTLNPNTNARYNYLDFYSELCGQLATDGKVYNSIVDSQNATVSSLENSRQMVVGVSSDDELQGIIKFQNAYNASSRYINVINEMLEQIISIVR